MPGNSREQIKAELEAELERLATERLRFEEERRRRVAEERRVATLESLIGRYANLGEIADGLIKNLREFLSFDEQRVFQQELADRFERLESILTIVVSSLILILAKRRNGVQLDQVQGELRQVQDKLDTARRKSLGRQLVSYHQRLNILEEKAAVYGSLEIPANLEIEMGNVQQEIERLEGILK